MHSLNIQIPDPTYAALEQAAAASGQSIEAIAAEQLSADFAGGDVPDSFFTPGILAEIDAARDEATQGGGLTLDQVRERRITKSKTWRENRPA